MGESSKHLVLIETASNQRNIFQTNRLRENIGASELIHRVGTTFVTKAIAAVTGAETIVSASGKAILLVDSADSAADAEAIIGRVTGWTVRECPGVTARGVHVPVSAWSAAGLDEAIKLAHQLINEVAAELPSPVSRFSKLPFVEPCASSGYPSTKLDPDRNLTGAVSEIVLAKRGARNEAMRRIGSDLPELKLSENLDDLEEMIDGNWVGIVHADGNGLGQVFLDFKSWVKDGLTCSPEIYIAALRCLSNAVDVWTKSATQSAINEVWGDDKFSKPRRAVEDKTQKAGGRQRRTNALLVPVIPVVMGGDDLTVICEGERSVLFAEAYLRHFEAASAVSLNGKLGELIPRLRAQGRVAAAAGIAIVKSHFPFHRAYELAEELTKSAKTAKDQLPEDVPCSALDFQVVLDSSVSDIDTIRDRMRTPRKDVVERLSMRPYVVTPIADIAASPSEFPDKLVDGLAWAQRRHFRSSGSALPNLLGAAEAVAKPAGDRDAKQAAEALPRSQVYGLLNALYQGGAVADTRLEQIVHRYQGFAWDSISVLGAKGRSLMVPDGGGKDEDGVERDRGTYLLDAMELVDLAGRENIKAMDAVPISTGAQP